MNQVKWLYIKKKWRSKKSKAMKVIGGFLCIVLVFTYVSRFASSIITPQVECETGAAGTIVNRLSVSGMVNSNSKQPIYVKPDLLVDEVLVSDGDSVKKGAPLLQINTKDLQEKKDQCISQIAVANASKKELLDAETASKRDRDNQMQALEKQIKAAKKMAKNSTETKEAQSEIETLGSQLKELKNTPVASANTTELDAQIKEQQKLIASYDTLLASGGVVVADSDMMIQSVQVEAGTRTADGAVLFASGSSENLTVVAQIRSSDCSMVNPGVCAKVYSYDLKDDVDTTVDSVVQDKTDMTLYDVFMQVPSDHFHVGMMTDINFEQESERYDMVLPWSAVRAGASGTYYVLVTDTKKTILGDALVAKSVGVKLKDSNEVECGITSDALSAENQIIVASDKHIKAGDTIRLLEQ